MKTRVFFAVALSCVCAATSFAAVPTTLVFADLANHMDRWPAAVTVLANVRTKSGQTVLQGQRLPVVNITDKAVFVQNAAGGQVGLSTEQCDVMKVANEQWAKWTPEQRALDVATILNDSSLWPDTVRMAHSAQISNEAGATQVVPRGTPCALLFCAQGDVGIVPRGVGQLKWFKPDVLDLIGPARERMAMPASKRPSKVIEAVRPLMRDAEGRPVVPASLDKTKVFVFFWGANWCGWCHKTSPELAKFMAKNGPSHPNLTFVMLDGDKEQSEMLKYLKEKNLPWPGVAMADWQRVPFFAQSHRNAWPQIMICDRYGKLLYEGNGGAPEDIAAHLEALNKHALVSAN